MKSLAVVMLPQITVHSIQGRTAVLQFFNVDVTIPYHDSPASETASSLDGDMHITMVLSCFRRDV